MAESPEEAAGDRAYRRRFTKKTGDKGEDYAVDLFREIDVHLDDVRRVDRLLLELGRFYDPLTNGPIVDLPSRRRVLELLTGGRPDEARAVVRELLTRYVNSPGTPETTDPS